jgi:hypothetical protein
VINGSKIAGKVSKGLLSRRHAASHSARECSCIDSKSKVSEGSIIKRSFDSGGKVEINQVESRGTVTVILLFIVTGEELKAL